MRCVNLLTKLGFLIFCTLSTALLAESSIQLTSWSTPLSEDTTEQLTVTGHKGEKHYSLASLEALGMHTLSTHTFWPEDDGSYQGVLLSDLLKDAGLKDISGIQLSAIDGFSQIIPKEDWQNWPLLLATRRDNAPISLRKKGPIRLIYPRDMDKQLEDGIYRLRWIWMINKIEAIY